MTPERNDVDKHDSSADRAEIFLPSEVKHVT